MRFKASILFVVLALLGGAGLFVARFALAQQPRGVQTVVQVLDADHDPRPTTAVPVLVDTPYVGRAFAVQSTAGGHDKELAELAQLDANLAQQSQQLIEQYGAATDDADRARLKEQLAQTLERQFESQQKLRELEVSRIETRLKTLRDLIAKRNESKRSIIGKRLDQLIGDAEGLGWNSPGAGPAIQYQSGDYLLPRAIPVPSPNVQGH
jgi:small-conductance mechanosensitive channel